MSANIAPSAEKAREQARQKTGEFGTQNHAESGIVDVTPDVMATQSYPCPECAHWARSTYKPQQATCPMCGGTGQAVVDPEAIGKALISSRDGRFRKSRPPLPGEKNGVYGAAYVWRMIRFNNGQDMMLPVAAGDYVGLGWSTRAEDKPLTDHLEALVDQFGDQMFGRMRMMRGAARWGQALGYEHADQVAAIVDRTVGMPGGVGSDIGGPDESPEAFLDEHTDLDGNVDLEGFE